MALAVCRWCLPSSMNAGNDSVRYSLNAGRPNRLQQSNFHILENRQRSSAMPSQGRARISAIRGKLDDGDGWLLENAELVRNMPLFLGIASFVAVVLSRTFSGIALVADASSAQSRADVLVLALSATVALTGLVWKSVEEKPQSPVTLRGVECLRVASLLTEDVSRELNWAWASLRRATRTRCMVVVYGTECLFQAGVAAEREDGQGAEVVDVNLLLRGSLCKAVVESKKQTYMANLALYPGRYELPFLPANTQAVILQPLGDDGVLILGCDMLRGFGPYDQKWIVAVGDKLDSSLAYLIEDNSVSSFRRVVSERL